MNNHGHQHLRDAKHARDFVIVEAFEKAQSKNLGGSRLQLTHGAGKGAAKISGVAVRSAPRQVDEFYGAVGLPRANHIQSRIDGRAAQVAFFVVERYRVIGPAKEAQKHGLRYVLGVCRVARDAVGCAEDQTVVCPERALEFVRYGDCPFLNNQYAWQGTPPYCGLSPLKTEAARDYYRPAHKFL